MVRVIVNGVSFYTTRARIKNRTVGSDSNLNVALSQVFENLHNAIGIGTTISLYDHKMKKHTYVIQINV